MSCEHIDYISKLQTDFHNIILLTTEISKIKEKIQENISHLKDEYQELIKLNTKKIIVTIMVN